MRRRHLPAAFTLSVLLSLAATVGVMAKGDAIVTLDATLPGDPEPGSEITIGWTVEIPLEDGGLAPFNAEGMFIRLIPTTGDPVEAVGRQGPLGHYVATLTAPATGIRAIEVGLRGESCSGGTCQRSDMLFAIDESVTPAIAPVVRAAPGADAAPQAPANAAAPASSAGDVLPFGILGLAAAAAIIVGVLVARDRDRARALSTDSGRS